MNLHWPIIVIVLQLIFLEGILSIDNAAVLGALVSPLPDNEGIPWPNLMKNLGKHLKPLLGHQRTAALRVGLLGAYLGRGAMLLLASALNNNSWVRLVGAAYLIRLAFGELGDLTPDQKTEDERQKAFHPSFWGIVLTVEIMDLIFSIDNVVAAVSLSDQLWVVMLGDALRGWHLQLCCDTRTCFESGGFHSDPQYMYAHIPFLQKFRFVLNWLQRAWDTQIA